MSWQLLTAISVLALSLSIILQRILIHKDKIDPVSYAVSFQLIVTVILTICALLFGSWSLDLDGLWIPAIGCMILFGIGHVVYARTLQRVEASVFSVLFASHAVWVSMVGVFVLGETLRYWQILGTFLIFASVVLIVKNIWAVKLNKGILMGLLTGVLFGLAISGWAYVGRTVEALPWAAVSFGGSVFVSFLVSPRSIGTIRSVMRSNLIWKLCALGVIYGVGSVAMLFAYKEGSFALVSPLRQTGIIVTTVLAIAFFPTERKNIKRKVAASVLAVSGAILIVI